MGQWVVQVNGFDTSGPGATAKVYAMGAGLAFSDAAYAPSGFVSWRSANQKVSVAQAGGVTLSADTGMLVIQNLPNDIGSAGPLDALADWAWQNRAAYLYWISDGTWANRQLVDVAVLQQPFATLVSAGDVQSSLQFQLRDPRYALAVPLQPTKFLGTNAGGQGVEGEADIKGQSKPILYGVVSNISPPRVNASQLIYQVADKAVTILCVRDGGLGLTASTNRGSLASLQSNTPTPGTYDYYAGTEGTFFKLGTTPVFQITCDAREGTQGTARTNLALRSEELNLTWTLTANTLTQNALVAPTGALTMDKVIPTAANTTHETTQTFTTVSGTTYCWSGHCEAAGYKIVLIRFGDVGESNAVQVQADLNTGQVFVAANGFGGSTILVGGGVIPMGDGVHRVWVSGNFPGITATKGEFYVGNNAGAFTFAGDAVSGIGAWGFQLEASAYPTQYIATGAATATDQNMSNRTHAQIWSRFRQERCGNVSGDIVSASVNVTDALDPNEVGFWWNADTTQLDAMNEILTSLSGYEVQGFDLKWSIAKLVAPSGTTALDFVVVGPASQLTSKNRAIRNLTRVRPDFAPDGAPPYRCTVNWGRNYTTMNEADFAGAAPQRLRDKFGQEYRSETATNTAIWDPTTSTGPWTNAPELTVKTAYQPGNNGLTAIHAKSEAARLQALYGANKGQFQVDFTPKVTDQITAGTICSIAYPQLGLSGGPLFTVLQSALTVEKEIARMSLVLGLQT